MYQVDHLQQGDKVAIVSPAGKIAKAPIEAAIEILENHGLQVVLGKHITNEHYRFAGTDAQRIADLQEALDHPEIKAIWCSRGGYGTVRIIEQLNFDLFRRYPKWLIGFSDITVLHAYINNILQIKSLHSIMPINLGEDKESLATLMSCLTQKIPDYTIPTHTLNKHGESAGQLWGGNLSILYSLRGTYLDFSPEGKILFIEDVGESLHHLDRMMHNLKMGNKLSALNGLIVGGMSQMNNDTPFGKSAYEIIFDAVKDYNYPVCFDFPAGHIQQNYALVLGQQVALKVAANKVILQMK